MQRRAAAVYLAFFLVAGAAAYGVMATSAAPEVSFDAETYAEGDSVTLNGQTFTVSAVDGTEGELTRTNESAELTATIENGSTVSPLAVQWDGQQARHEAIWSDGDTVAYNGSDYDVSVANATLTLARADNASINESYEAGGTITVNGTERNVTEISDGAATLVWGDEYLLAVENATDPTEADLIQQRNVTQLATDDPALYNETIRQDGVLKVTYRENNTNVPVDEYFGEVERHTIEEGGTLAYQGNETTVDSVDNESVTLAWSGSAPITKGLAQGGNFTVDDTQYFAHFPDNSSVQVLEASEKYGDYKQQNQRIDYYGERKNGLWGVIELSAIAAVILLSTALLPVRG